MSTFIHGIGASEVVDSSGEVVSISGMDISSLARDGVFNWEHKKDTPMQTVGKVLKAKKIFSEEDCEDDNQLYFWNKVQCPYVYVMGELFDDYTESAKHLAGMFMYDADRKGKQEFNVVSFSIEGATIEKQGNIVTRSIARKVTVTNLPCNKTAGAEMVQTNQKDDLHDLFKTENPGILILKVEPPRKLASDLKKHAEALGIPMNKAEVPAPKTTLSGQSIGPTSSGKNVMSHGKAFEYHNFSHQDHLDAAHLHQEAATQHHQLKNGKMVDHHMQKKKMHLQAADTAKRKMNRFGAGMENRQKKLNAATGAKLGKAMTADSGMAAPGQLTGGAALAKESLDKKLRKEEAPPPAPPTLGQTATSGGTATINSAIGSPFGKKEKQGKPLKKAEMLERAESEYAQWKQRDQFVQFMKAKMPKLTKGEIDAIGQTIALKKALEAEASLAKLTKALKFGSEEDQKHVAEAEAKRIAAGPKKREPKKPTPDLKGVVESEVAHVKTTGGHSPKGYSEHDTITLKSGHELHGHPKGKFKVGDKVTAKPHLMGTHVMHHGHSKK